jgi:hypothetical protein
MVIVPHKIIIVQTTAPLLAMTIENQNVVQMNKLLFDVIWSSQAR